MYHYKACFRCFKMRQVCHYQALHSGRQSSRTISSARPCIPECGSRPDKKHPCSCREVSSLRRCCSSANISMPQVPREVCTVQPTGQQHLSEQEQRNSQAWLQLHRLLCKSLRFPPQIEGKHEERTGEKKVDPPSVNATPPYCFWCYSA